jgi:hypothetical protein
MEEPKRVNIICLPYAFGLREADLVEKIGDGYLLKEDVRVLFTEDTSKEAEQKLLLEAAQLLNDNN